MNDWRQTLAFEPMVEASTLWLCVAFCVVVLVVMWRASGTLSRGRRLGLSLLRLALCSGLILTLMGPGMRYERVVPVPGTVLVLVDRSASMDIESRRKAVKRLLSPDQISRLQRDFSVLKFSFSSSLEPLELSQLD